MTFWASSALLAIVVAALCDVAHRRIPNAVIVLLALCGAAAAWNEGGLSGLGSSLAAAAIAVGLLIPAWRLKTLGGGDVKLAAACCALVGLSRIVEFGLAAAIAGGAVSIVCFACSSADVRRDVLANLRLATMRAMPAVSAGRSGRLAVPYGAALGAAAAFVLLRN